MNAPCQPQTEPPEGFPHGAAGRAPLLVVIFRGLRAAPLPHATGGVAAAVGLGLSEGAVKALAEDAFLASGMLFTPALGWLGLSALCLADGAARVREYKRLKGMLARRGFSPRLLKPLSTSRCQRDAALQAARELGLHSQAKAYFHSLGYRWRHILPDRVVARPLAFLDQAFLRATFLPGKKGRT